MSPSIPLSMPPTPRPLPPTPSKPYPKRQALPPQPPSRPRPIPSPSLPRSPPRAACPASAVACTCALPQPPLTSTRPGPPSSTTRAYQPRTLPAIPFLAPHYPFALARVPAHSLPILHSLPALPIPAFQLCFTLAPPPPRTFQTAPTSSPLLPLVAHTQAHTRMARLLPIPITVRPSAPPLSILLVAAPPPLRPTLSALMQRRRPSPRLCPAYVAPQPLAPPYPSRTAPPRPPPPPLQQNPTPALVSVTRVARQWARLRVPAGTAAMRRCAEEPPRGCGGTAATPTAAAQTAAHSPDSCRLGCASPTQIGRVVCCGATIPPRPAPYPASPRPFRLPLSRRTPSRYLSAPRYRLPPSPHLVRFFCP